MRASATAVRFALLLGGLTFASTVSAQTKAEDIAGQTASAQSSPVCMARTKTGRAAGLTDASSKPTRIVVPQMVVSGLASKGFEIIPCEQAKLESLEARQAWRDKICAKSVYGNQAVQNQYARLYGERPAALCAAAQLVAGKIDVQALKSRATAAKSDK